MCNQPIVEGYGRPIGEGVGVPRSVEEVDLAWLNRALAAFQPGVEATGMTSEIGRSPRNQNFGLRIKVEYKEEGQASRLPKNLWLKGRLGDLTREIFCTWGLFENEVRFYAELLPKLTIPTPRFIAGVLDQNGEGALLLEDIVAERGAEFSSVIRPVEPPQAEATLLMLADMHARFWDSSELEKMPWLASLDSPRENTFYDWFLTEEARIPLLEDWLNRPRGLMVPQELRDPFLHHNALGRLFQRSSSPPLCINHGDLWLGNFAFLPDGNPIFNDFQLLRKSRWAGDVSYFIGSALEIEDRRNYETKLLTSYLNRLHENGVSAPTFEEAWEDYRANMFFGFSGWLTNPDSLTPEEISRSVAERFYAAVVDLDTLSLLT